MARDWHSPEELQRDAAIFLKLIHVLAGLYYWEFVTSLGFEWKFISGKKKFHWPMIFYFGARYCMLASLTGLYVHHRTWCLSLKLTCANGLPSPPHSKINCRALYTWSGITGQSTAGFVSLILGVRTLVIWQMRWWVVVPFVAASLAQWAVVLRGGVFTGSWVDGSGCVFAASDLKAQIVTVVYSMAFDFCIIAMATFKLTYGRQRRSKATNILFKDGLIYYIFAFLGNVPAVVMMSLNLNPIFNVMLNVPAAVVFTTAACRAVRHLANFQSTKPDVYTPSAPSSQGSQSRSGGGLVRPPAKGPIDFNYSQNSQQGVRVQMDTYQLTDVESTTDNKTTQILDVK
ncbi:hypothetical protein NLI96_g1284 [Meripilus lineatus]|uniref:Uncharacterized protein n=1 Tax=Meripilus lineatus TaxID=2056292 RepID=A0AAD5YN36_9APHY|nr:hypothetical protein NLI96_g1284 [Physisporinus lineatus]